MTFAQFQPVASSPERGRTLENRVETPRPGDRGYPQSKPPYGTSHGTPYERTAWTSRKTVLNAGRLPTQGFVEAGGAEQNVLQSRADRFGTEGLSAHCGVSIEGSDDRVQQFGLEVRRVRELLFRVVVSLLHQRFGFEQLPQDHVVDVDELVLVRQVSRKQVVDLGDDLGE